MNTIDPIVDGTLFHQENINSVDRFNLLIREIEFANLEIEPIKNLTLDLPNLTIIDNGFEMLSRLQNLESISFKYK